VWKEENIVREASVKLKRVQRVFHNNYVLLFLRSCGMAAMLRNERMMECGDAFREGTGVSQLPWLRLRHALPILTSNILSPSQIRMIIRTYDIAL
jgi:hypothetical protein